MDVLIPPFTVTQLPGSQTWIVPGVPIGFTDRVLADSLAVALQQAYLGGRLDHTDEFRRLLGLEPIRPQA